MFCELSSIRPNNLAQSSAKRVVMKRLLVFAIALCLPHLNEGGQQESRLLAQEANGIDVGDRFEITQVATDKIASNIFCMAVDPQGRVFVSGPGYIKVLVDSDGDGVFENATLFSDRLKSGAQGMAFDQTELLCTGDGGVWKFSDVDRDGVADGPPKKMLAIKTGGEHDAHAIRKGPSGWWYLIAGNGTPISPDYNSLLSTPVKEPRAGFLMRISPDWSKKEIFAHGFRNAYDFDFASDGSIFVFDSDGERDISLPLYRPTRVFQIHAGDDAGWVSAGWKRPAYFFDMPKVVDSLGRGSPTGVKIAKPKRSTDGTAAQFNADAIFVADWTFGRVLVSPIGARRGTRDSFRDFAVAKGQTGFAVTDLDLDSSGDLLISVGGRGTEGGVYRVAPLHRTTSIFRGDPAEQRLASIPREVLLSMWMKSEMDYCPFEVLLRSLAGWSEANLRNQFDKQQIQRLSDHLNKSILGMDASNAALWMRIFSEWSEETIPLVETWPVSIKLACRVSRQDVSGKKQVQILADIVEALEQEKDPLFLIRLGQLVFGGCGGDNAKAMFAGYTPRSPLQIDGVGGHEIANQLGALLELYRVVDLADQEFINVEIGRLAALVGVGTRDLFAQISVELIQPNISVENRIHWMNCVAILANKDDGSTSEDRLVIARSLAGITEQVRIQKLATDRNFEPRLKTLYRKLRKAWGEGFELELASQLTGVGEQLFFVSDFGPKAKQAVVAKVLSWVKSNPQEVVSSHLKLLGSDHSADCFSVIRGFSNRRDLRPVVISNLIGSPQISDRDLFIAGLSSAELLTVKNSAIGLRRIQEPVGAGAMLAALRTLQRMTWDKSTVSVRDQLMMFLESETRQDFGYRPKASGTPQEAVLVNASNWIQTHYPNEFAEYQNKYEPGKRGLVDRLASVDWNQGDSTRGAKVYQALQCARCHDAGSRLGPRLEGLGKRFSRDDLFRAIVYPSEQVPQRYRAVAIETVEGQFFQGAMVYESVDGITLQQTDGKTVRINRDQIELQTHSSKSLMPEGLLDQATDLELADLNAYLAR